MKKKQNILFDLISALDGNEKKIFLQSHTQGKYIELLKEIIKLKVADEDTLLKKFSSSSLPFLKNYLYHQLLEFAVLKNIQFNGEFALQLEFEKIKKLLYYQLYNQFEIEIRRIKKKCYESQEYNVLLKALDTSITYHLKLQDKNDYLIIEQDLELYKKINAVWNQFLAIRHFYNYIIIELNKSRIIIDDVQLVNLQQAFLQIPQNDYPSIKHKVRDIYFEACQTLMNYYNSNHQSAFEHGLQFKLLYKKKYGNKVSIKYFQTIYYFINNLIILKKYDVLESELNHIKALKLNTDNENAWRYYIYYSCTTRYLASTFQYKKLAAIAGQINRRFQRHLPYFNLDQKSTLFMNCAIVNFVLEKYDNAIYWIQEFYTMPKKLIRNDAKSFTRAFKLLIYYELKDAYTIELLYEKTKLELKKEKSSSEFEMAILEFIKRHIHGIMQVKNCKILKEKLQSINKKNKETKIMSYFNFDRWCESKIEHLSYMNYNLRNQ